MGIKKLKGKVAKAHGVKLEDISTSKEIKNWDNISLKDKIIKARKIALDNQKNNKKSKGLEK